MDNSILDRWLEDEPEYDTMNQGNNVFSPVTDVNKE